MEELNFEKLLPSEPTEKEKKIIAKEFLTADAVVYRAGVYINPLSGIGEKMCKCTCSACGSTHILLVHSASSRLPWWWHVECKSCHYCGKTKLFLRRAVKSWNKEKKK